LNHSCKSRYSRRISKKRRIGEIESYGNEIESTIEKGSEESLQFQTQISSELPELPELSELFELPKLPIQDVYKTNGKAATEGCHSLQIPLNFQEENIEIDQTGIIMSDEPYIDIDIDEIVKFT
jgi:hypothetical protein